MFRSTIRNAWGCFGQPLQARIRSFDGFEGRSSLGRRRQGLAENHRAERHLRRSAPGRSPRTHPYTGYFKKGSQGADDRPVLVGRQRNEARTASLDQSRHEDLSDDGSRPSDAVDSGERDRAGRSRRHAHGLHQRRRARATRRTCTPTAAGSTSSSCFAPARSSSSSTKSATAVSSTRLPSSASLPDEPINAPDHLLLKMSPGQRRIEGDGLDFRDEIYGHIFKPGDTAPTGSMEFDISVSDTGKRSGFQGLSTRDGQRLAAHRQAEIHRGDLLRTTPTTSSSSIIRAGATTGTIRPRRFAPANNACAEART